jgi:hypothetical protein
MEEAKSIPSKRSCRRIIHARGYKADEYVWPGYDRTMVFMQGVVFQFFFSAGGRIVGMHCQEWIFAHLFIYLR